MLLSKVIERLTAIMNEQGDGEVVVDDSEVVDRSYDRYFDVSFVYGKHYSYFTSIQKNENYSVITIK